MPIMSNVTIIRKRRKWKVLEKDGFKKFSVHQLRVRLYREINTFEKNQRKNQATLIMKKIAAGVKKPS